jgi:hypothetical protein
MNVAFIRVINFNLKPLNIKPLNLPTFDEHPGCRLEASSLHALTVSLSNFLPLLGRGGHPFFLDKKGRKSQGKTKCSARFSGPPAQYRSKWIMVCLKNITQ